jgi:hypothetical protein
VSDQVRIRLEGGWVVGRFGGTLGRILGFAFHRSLSSDDRILECCDLLVRPIEDVLDGFLRSFRKFRHQRIDHRAPERELEVRREVAPRFREDPHGLLEPQPFENPRPDELGRTELLCLRHAAEEPDGPRVEPNGEGGRERSLGPFDLYLLQLTGRECIGYPLWGRPRG